MEEHLIILGIESSCDETACAITDNGKLLANVISSQIDVHRKYGGVMPEIASRLHLENVGCVIQEALEKANVKMEDITAIAVTNPTVLNPVSVTIKFHKETTVAGNLDIIPIKIIIEIPFPIPLFVICSPSHINIAVPVIKETTTNKPVKNPGLINIPEDL